MQSNLCTLIATCCFNSCGEQSLSLKDNVHRTDVSDTRITGRWKNIREAGWSQVPVYACALWLGAWYLLSDVTWQWPCLWFVTIPHHSSLTPSLPQAVTFPGWKMHGRACREYFSGPAAHLFSILCVLMKTLSHANVKRRQKCLKVSDFALLLVVFKWHHGSEGVNSVAWLRLTCL